MLVMKSGWVVMRSAFSKVFCTSSYIMVALLILMPEALSKDWSGIRPGMSTIEDVRRHLGEPTKEFKPRTGSYLKAWSYQFRKDFAKRKGVSQANFYFDNKGICKRIDVFPSVKLKMKDIEAAYGKQYRRGLTSAFQRYMFYPETGLAAFIEDDGETVFSLQFLESMETRMKSLGSRRSRRPVKKGNSHDTLRFHPKGSGKDRSR